jgi:chromosome partitioning protein
MGHFPSPPKSGPQSPPKPPQVIVLGNEKGGSGKSTIAVNLIVALMKAGHRVASIDTDSRQLSLTRYLENRARWSRKAGLSLETPTHFSVQLGEGKVVSQVEASEFASFTEIIDRLGERFDFVVIDTPGNDSYRMRLSHAMADILITPVNDSFVDLDVLARGEENDPAAISASQYSELVQTARRDRLTATGSQMDWVVVRNRIAPLGNRNQRKVADGLQRLADKLGFRVVDGVLERVVFREFFTLGLTAFDRLDAKVLGSRPTLSHLAARREIRELLHNLKLPLQATGVLPAGGEPAPAAGVAAE